jgi:endonuclease-3
LQSTQILKEQYSGDIPPNAVAMMELPGIGPKMAYIIENVAWKQCSGIGIDTHMHRIFNQLGWVSSKNPEQTRRQLQSWLPEEYWPSVNLLWVGFGQEVQQFKPKLLRKALESSRPQEALRLVKKLGLDYRKEAEKAGLNEKLQEVVSKKQGD